MGVSIDIDPSRRAAARIAARTRCYSEAEALGHDEEACRSLANLDVGFGEEFSGFRLEWPASLPAPTRR